MNNQDIMKALLGQKIEMTQIFGEDGVVHPVTLIAAGPCTVTAVRTVNGRRVALLGLGKAKHAAKPQTVEAGDLGASSFVREFALTEDETLERGQTLGVDVFAVGDLVNVTGTSKGKGFQGVVKRHGFRGHPATHGHKDQLRKSGSIGAGGVQRVFKGMRMAGRMGSDCVMVKNLKVIAVDSAKNTIAVRGAIPGSRGSLVTLIATKGNVWLK